MPGDCRYTMVPLYRVVALLHCIASSTLKAERQDRRRGAPPLDRPPIRYRYP
jgi:hypothetical protein